jgi:hypothetical protein
MAEERGEWRNGQMPATNITKLLVEVGIDLKSSEISESRQLLLHGNQKPVNNSWQARVRRI